jgi:hypothetical protein
MRLPVVRWFFSLPASIFYCLAASSIYDALDSPKGIPAAVALLAELLAPTGIALWLLADARQRGRSLPYDAGTFFFVAWPILAPIYLFSTRGWRAFAVFGWFLLLYLGAAFFYHFLYYLWAAFQ